MFKMNLGAKSGSEPYSVNLELGHHFSKNIMFALASVRTGQTLVSLVTYDQKAASMRVNGKGSLLVSFIVDTNYFSP